LDALQAMAPSLTCKRKLQKELHAFSASPPPHIPRVFVDEADICSWFALLEGPPGTPYEGGWYIAKLRFPARCSERCSREELF
jgi:ubiquitin-protein ligase